MAAQVAMLGLRPSLGRADAIQHRLLCRSSCSGCGRGSGQGQGGRRQAEVGPEGEVLIGALTPGRSSRTSLSTFKCIQFSSVVCVQNLLGAHRLSNSYWRSRHSLPRTVTDACPLEPSFSQRHAKQNLRIQSFVSVSVHVLREHLVRRRGMTRARRGVV